MFPMTIGFLLLNQATQKVTLSKKSFHPLQVFPLLLPL